LVGGDKNTKGNKTKERKNQEPMKIRKSRNWRRLELRT